jgi:signal transduction histidine kinase
MWMVLHKLQGQGEDSVTLSRSVLERMIQSNENLLYLLSSLQESHITKQRLVLPKCNVVHLDAVTQATLQKLEATFKTNYTTIVNRISQDLPAVAADAIQIQQVLECLISNAVKHNSPGLTVTLEAELVEDPCCAENCITSPSQKMLRYSVQDNGIGLEPEQCDRLFQLHSRSSHNCHLTGIGLGLHRSHQIITAQGGHIGVVSAPKAGATFWFTLPLHSEAEFDQPKQLIHTNQVD